MNEDKNYQTKSDFYANTDGHGYYYLQISGKDGRWDCIRTEWHDNKEDAFEEFKVKLRAFREEIDRIVG